MKNKLVRKVLEKSKKNIKIIFINKFFYICAII